MKASAAARAKRHGELLDRGKPFKSKGHAYAAGYRRGYQAALATLSRRGWSPVGRRRDVA